ncbi:PQQ-binding-like beta-propeller repeat protein [Streptomyces sp. bgisy126]|uniref:outer membrane protein assembly factor BamB family protein n=1 Tax=unclassified Streptomyces TaxID=2593676 RepID=UPI003EBE319A
MISAAAAFVCFNLSREGYLPGDGMSRVWEAPHDRDVPAHGNASWLHGDVVVRARFDAVTGFDVSTGRERWEYTVPDVAEICATSATADRNGIAVIAFGSESGAGTAAGGCATVAAIDLDTGEEVWRTSAPSASSLEGNHGVVAVGGGSGGRTREPARRRHRDPRLRRDRRHTAMDRAGATGVRSAAGGSE